MEDVVFLSRTVDEIMTVNRTYDYVALFLWSGRVRSAHLTEKRYNDDDVCEESRCLIIYL